MHAHTELRNVKETMDTPSTHSNSTCANLAMYISCKCEHKGRKNMAETDESSVCSDSSSSGGTCYTCTWKPLHSPHYGSKECISAVCDYYPERVAQKASAILSVPSSLQSPSLRLAALVAYRCAV